MLRQVFSRKFLFSRKFVTDTAMNIQERFATIETASKHLPKWTHLVSFGVAVGGADAYVNNRNMDTHRLKMVADMESHRQKIVAEVGKRLDESTKHMANLIVESEKKTRAHFDEVLLSM